MEQEQRNRIASINFVFETATYLCGHVDTYHPNDLHKLKIGDLVACKKCIIMSEGASQPVDKGTINIETLYRECLELTLSKRHDYTASHDNHENFKRSAEVASWFESDQDKAYVVLIGTKLARLASLLKEGRSPNHESVKDTFKDLINYCGLWAERRL